MGIFDNQKNNVVVVSQRQLLQNKYVSACNNILWVVLFTTINIILLVTNSNTYFLFSAYIPYLLADLGMLFCGKYPAEIYTEELVDLPILSDSFLVVTLGIAAVILVLYFLSWVFSKKQKRGWLIFALAFFSIDTLALIFLNGFLVESIIDYVFHAWVIICLVSGLVSFSKLKKLPAEDESKLPFEQPVLQTTDSSYSDELTK